MIENVVDKIIVKIRSLVEDISKKSSESFIYLSSSVFILTESNIIDIIRVQKNGSTLGSGEFDYDPLTNEITITASLVSGDIIIVDFNYYSKYSDTEIRSYIEGALAYISLHYCQDFEMEHDLDVYELFPTPTNRETDMIAMVASILMKPNYSEYKLANVTIKYPRIEDKDKKIWKLIKSFQKRIGIFDTIDFVNDRTIEL
ncbi:hypothetical protein DRJ17_06110 [Candidatus Woesearchaeota archaeon]|nr:MAG: hypothetical protein DRJ17_06110 [Candidatus Woesearchaeota archaeon]